MNKQNTDILCTKFPNLYDEDFYFECNDGWFNLIYDLSEKINKLMTNVKGEARTWIEVVQVKEKFGTMRFYMSTGTEEIFEVIDEAEKESAHICEMCGNPGTTRCNGWFVTLCNDCNEKR